MSDDETDRDADPTDEEPSVEAVLADLTESHRTLAETVTELQGMVEQQSETIQSQNEVLEALIEREDVAADALVTAYHAGTEDGAEKAVGMAKRRDSADHSSGGADESVTVEDLPRGFQ